MKPEGCGIAVAISVDEGHMAKLYLRKELPQKYTP